MNHRSSATSAPQAACRVASHALLECPLSEIGELRNRPAPTGGPPLPPRFLRHADEQTVVGLHAVLAAIARDPRPRDLAGQAVVAAPCQSGRLATARALAQLPVGGAASVSPHIVPQCSLHSVAGAVSVALGMHGPHLGVGGGPQALAEGLFAAVSLVTGAVDRGGTAWLVASDWDEEPQVDAALGRDPVCRALAVLLEPAAAAGGDGTETLAVSIRTPSPQAGTLRLHEPSGDLAAFARALAMCAEGGALATWTIICPWGAEIRVSGRRRVAALREAA